MSVLRCPVCRTAIELYPEGSWEIDIEINGLANECSIAMNNLEVHLCHSQGGGGALVREPRRPTSPPPRLADIDWDEWLSSQVDG